MLKSNTAHASIPSWKVEFDIPEQIPLVESDGSEWDTVEEHSL